VYIRAIHEQLRGEYGWKGAGHYLSPMQFEQRWLAAQRKSAA
jgi:hypothetical protein